MAGGHKVLLALDQGTTSSRAIVFDRDGEVRGIGQRATRQEYPRPGWVNQDAVEIWESTLGVAREALAATGVEVDAIAAIGITNQRETTVLWERASGKPVAPAIVWQSRQTAGLVDAIVARGMGPTYTRLTGLVPDAYFSATKVAWLLDEDRELRRRAEAGEVLFGTVDSWLLWNLSGGTALATGRVAILIDGSWALQDISKLGFNFGCGVLPKIKDPATVAVAHCHVIDSSTEHPEAAWKLLAYLSSDDYQRGLCAVGLWLPSHTSLLSTEGLATWITEGVHPEGYSAIASDYLLNYATALPYPAGYAEAERLITAALDPVWIGDATAADALNADLIAQIDAVLADGKAKLDAQA